MVSCHQDILGSVNDEISSDENSSCQRSPPRTLCTNIVGRDHLKMKRARRFRCKSKRIRNLAQPKYLTEKYSEQNLPKKKTSVEIVRAYEEQTPVRINLLAYPKVRKLVSSREAYKGVVDKQWYGRFEDLIKRSMFTMYSRLANVQLPEKSQRNKWTKADWQRHCEWLKKRALPKREKHPKPVERKKVPLSDLIGSMYELSRPRNPRSKHVERCGFISTVKSSAKLYEPTERILKLAAPKFQKDEVDEDDLGPFHVNPNALSFKPSERIILLATPKPLPPPADNSDLTPYGVLKRALKAKTNQRTLELSKPKEKTDDDEDEEDKPLVNPKALKAKPTPRILKLAEPRPPIPEKFKF